MGCFGSILVGGGLVPGVKVPARETEAQGWWRLSAMGEQVGRGCYLHFLHFRDLAVALAPL